MLSPYWVGVAVLNEVNRKNFKWDQDTAGRFCRFHYPERKEQPSGKGTTTTPGFSGILGPEADSTGCSCFRRNPISRNPKACSLPAVLSLFLYGAGFFNSLKPVNPVPLNFLPSFSCHFSRVFVVVYISREVLKYNLCFCVPPFVT